MAKGHGHHNIVEPKRLELPRAFTIACLVLVVLGVLAFVAGLIAGPVDLEVARQQLERDPEREVVTSLILTSNSAWNGFLIGFWFTLSLALSGPFIVATQHLSIAGWSASIRRVPEAYGAFLPVAAVAALILAIGTAAHWHHLYHWADEVYALADPVLSKKLGFLNTTGMFLCVILAFVAWIGLWLWMRRSSLKQDETGDYRLTERMKWASAMFIASFATGISFMAWYFLMSLQPHWFSTMFSVYTFAGLFQSGLALTVVLVILLERRGFFGNLVGVKQVHDLGKLLFGFTTFYAYIAFCQFLLIWYANIPEEDIWYVTRFTNGWGGFSLILPFIKFIIPFLVLLPQEIKKNRDNILFYVALALIFVQLYEVWYWVAPVPLVAELEGDLYREVAVSPSLPVLELLIALGFVGGFGLLVGRALTSHNLVPIKDPFLAESIPHHH